jgi:flagellar hook assembly protein FlgD
MSNLMNVKQVNRCKKTFETFKTMMKKMTNSENLVEKQITIKRKTRQRDIHLIVHLIIKKC